MHGLAILASSVHWGGFKWTGSFTTIDLIAASRTLSTGRCWPAGPTTTSNFTVVGILLMALLGGLGGGITRDVLLGEVPSALTNPAYITLCLGLRSGRLPARLRSGQLFREGLFQFMTSFSLPWYAIVGAQKGVEQDSRCSGASCSPCRPDRRPLANRRLERCDAEAVHPRRVVRLDRGVDGRSLDPRSPGPAQGPGWPPASPSWSDSRSASSRSTAPGRSRSPGSRAASTSTPMAGRCWAASSRASRSARCATSV